MAQSTIYENSSVNPALRDAFRKMRTLTTTNGLTENDAISLMSVAPDPGIMQIVDSNCGVPDPLRTLTFHRRASASLRREYAPSDDWLAS